MVTAVASKTDMRRLERQVGELASISLQMAKRVYSADEDEDMMPYEEGEEEIMDLADDEEKVNPVGSLEKNDDEDDEDDELFKRFKRAKARATSKARRSKGKVARKGYANSAEVASDEEDAKWDEKDADVEGNEAQPQGEGNLEDPHSDADREEETFGPGGMAYSAMVKQIKGLTRKVDELSGGTVVKDITPANSGFNKGREAGETTGGIVVTRDMEGEAKNRSYRELNTLRTQVGDLPAFAGMFGR